MKRVYCTVCGEETYNDITEEERTKTDAKTKEKKRKCAHPKDEEALQKKINRQVATRTLLVKTRPTGMDSITWVVTYSRSSTMETKYLFPERHQPFCK
jgi:uncharacterized Zn finger protein (UPF0148 family)